MNFECLERNKKRNYKCNTLISFNGLSVGNLQQYICIMHNTKLNLVAIPDAPRLDLKNNCTLNSAKFEEQKQQLDADKYKNIICSVFFGYQLKLNLKRREINPI